jgi:hypothetical protein
MRFSGANPLSLAQKNIVIIRCFISTESEVAILN